MPDPAPIWGFPPGFDIADLAKEKLSPTPLLIDNEAVPATETDLFTSTAETWNLKIINTTGDAITITAKNRADTPVALIPGMSIPANNLVEISGRMLWENGIRWSASAVGLIVQSGGRTY